MIRQLLVEVIIRLWAIMPDRVRTWAFFNDGAE